MNKLYSKGDIIAIIETRVTQFMIGSGRPSETSTTIRIVQVASASRNGALLLKYRTHPKSPIYKYDNHYARYKLLTISGAMQANAQRLFAAALAPLNFDDQEKAKGAILFA